MNSDLIKQKLKNSSLPKDVNKESETGRVLIMPDLHKMERTTFERLLKEYSVTKEECLKFKEFFD